MSTKEKSKSYGSLDGFGGLDTSSPIGEGRTVALKNFKQLQDGSIIKRGGYKLLVSLDDSIRGEIAYIDGGEEVILAVAGNKLYRISTETGEYVSEECFNETDTPVTFFEFRGSLHIIADKAFYKYNGGTNISPVLPYIPVVTLSSNYGSYNCQYPERLNMLTNKVRLQFEYDGSSILGLTSKLKLRSVDGIYVDDTAVQKSIYTLEKDGINISIADSFESYKGNMITVYATLYDEPNRSSDFESCNKASVFDSFSNSRVFLYGGNDENRFYVSEPINNKNELDHQSAVYNDYALPLYFPISEGTHFGSMEKISAMCRVHDRMMIFTKKRAFATEELSEITDSRDIVLDVRSYTVGCSSFNAVRQIDGISPVSVSYGGIYKWELDPTFNEDIVCKKMSDRIDSLMSKSFFENARVCYNRNDEEIWFALHDTGEVFIYNTALKTWYMYTDIFVERFIETGSGVSFIDGKDIFIFDGGECDITKDGIRQIEGYVESAFICFQTSKGKKHVSGLNFVCELDKGSISAVLDDGEVLDTSVLEGNNSIDLFDLRIRTPRTNKVKFKLTAGGLSRQRIYGVSLLTD